MKKITKQQLVKMEFKPKGPQRNKSIYDGLALLKVGEIVMVTNKDWVGKSSPVNVLRNMCIPGALSRYHGETRAEQFVGKRFIFRTLKDDKGWVITRRK